MPDRPPLQTITTGFVVAVIGFFSSFPILLQGVQGVGATPDQSASALMAGAIAMGLAGIVMSLRFRAPISSAWSTPGVAFLAVSGGVEGGFAAAIGAFILAGVLAVLTGLWKPLARFVESIPPVLAQAMLAGVLVHLCIAPFAALAEAPEVALPIIATWFLVSRWNRLFAVPAAVMAALGVTIYANSGLPLGNAILTRPVWTTPEFTLSAAISLGLPLYVITMATQNIPGIAVLKGFGYRPPAPPLLATVGGISALSAPFGAPATCIAAITAVMCASEDSHPDPAKRYWSAVIAGLAYILFGVFAVAITSIALAAPAHTMATLTGVALLGVFASATHAAFAKPAQRDGAVLTFLFTASGVSLLGLNAAIWGLALGGIVLWLSGTWSEDAPE